MRTIFKKIGIVIGAIAAIALIGCNKKADGGNSPKSPDEKPVPETNGVAEPIYGMPAGAPAPDTDNPTPRETASEPLPSDEDNGIMALYGMPDDLDDSQNPPVANSEQPLPNDRETAKPIYGMPADFNQPVYGGESEEPLPISDEGTGPKKRMPATKYGPRPAGNALRPR